MKFSDYLNSSQPNKDQLPEVARKCVDEIKHAYSYSTNMIGLSDKQARTLLKSGFSLDEFWSTDEWKNISNSSTVECLEFYSIKELSSNAFKDISKLKNILVDSCDIKGPIIWPKCLDCMKIYNCGTISLCGMSENYEGVFTHDILHERLVLSNTKVSEGGIELLLMPGLCNLITVMSFSSSNNEKFEKALNVMYDTVEKLGQEAHVKISGYEDQFSDFPAKCIYDVQKALIDANLGQFAEM